MNQSVKITRNNSESVDSKKTSKGERSLSRFANIRKIAIAIGLFMTLATTATIAQGKRIPASAGREEFIEVEKNVKLHVTDLGDGQPLVLIHGWPLSDEMYEYQYQYFSRKGFRVIGISLRGFGKSDKPYGKYDFDVFSDDIKVVLEKLKIENAVLGGFSMGGAVVLHYTTKYNAAHISKLALFAPAGPSWVQRPGFPYGLTQQEAEAFANATMTNRPQVIGGFDFSGSETSLPKGLADWIYNINMQASPYATTESIKALAQLDLRPELKKIKVPVAIFHGAKDKLLGFVFAEELHKGIKDSYIVKFENSGHALFVEELDKFNTELEKFAKK